MGTKLRTRLSNDVGFQKLLDLLREYGDIDLDTTPETFRDDLLAALQEPNDTGEQEVRYEEEPTNQTETVRMGVSRQPNPKVMRDIHAMGWAGRGRR